MLERYAPPAVPARRSRARGHRGHHRDGSVNAKDMGRVMKAVMAALAGKTVDGKAVNELVRKKLAGG